MDLVTPKYLTEEVAEKAINVALGTVMESPLRELLHRNHCHVVMLVPAMKDDRKRNYPEWPNYPVIPYPIHQKSVGDPVDWEHDYAGIAQCKALQLWTGRNDDRTIIIPHLVFPGDTPFWGGVKRREIVVTCSGYKPWIDKLVSGIAADTAVALAHDAYENDEERKKGVEFLS